MVLYLIERGKMSWNGSVRCGYCYKEGHNRRTCPDLFARMEKRREEDPDDIYAKYYFNKRTKKKKKCSYCSGKGHTRPTCKELKYAKKVTVEKCSKWRHELVKHLKEMGLGVGALVQYVNWSKEIVGVVTEIKWGNLTHLHQHGRGECGFIFTALDLDRNNQAYGYLPQIPGFHEPHFIKKFHLLSPITSESFDKQIPEGFLASEDCVEFVFREREVTKYKTTWDDIADWCPKKGFYDD
tara:strand:- start:1372 stop:2088 length:717 start_codon:yes stop_codon:yes gene_type:complete